MKPPRRSVVIGLSLVVAVVAAILVASYQCVPAHADPFRASAVKTAVKPAD